MGLLKRPSVDPRGDLGTRVGKTHPPRLSLSPRLTTNQLANFTLFTSAGLVGALLALATGLLVFLFFRHRDGRAFGTRARPDLYTVPGRLIYCIASISFFLRRFLDT